VSLIGRIFVIFFAVMLATLAAGIAIAIGLLGPEWQGFNGDVTQRAGFWVLVLFTSSFTGAVGLLPLLIFIVLAEAFAWRSIFIHAAAGAAILLLGYYGSGMGNRYEESIDREPPPVSRETQLAAAAGAVFGLTYWLIAGRKSGAWRKRAAA
jgi:hypothetical protein